MDGDLTTEEIRNALKQFKKNKTPGDDGCSAKFCESFLNLIEENPIPLTAIKLSKSLRKGIISPILNEENWNKITNWRLITLITVD